MQTKRRHRSKILFDIRGENSLFCRSLEYTPRGFSPKVKPGISGGGYEKTHRNTVGAAVLAACAQMTGQPRANAGRSAEAKYVALVGFNDLQARSAYQPVIHRQGNRFIAYIGHHGGSALNPLTGRTEPNGTSVVDVTDPRSPKYLAHVPGSVAGSGEAGGAQMVRACDGKDFPK